MINQRWCWRKQQMVMYVLLNYILYENWMKYWLNLILDKIPLNLKSIFGVITYFSLLFIFYTIYTVSGMFYFSFSTLHKWSIWFIFGVKLDESSSFIFCFFINYIFSGVFWMNRRIWAKGTGFSFNILQQPSELMILPMKCSSYSPRRWGFHHHT